MAHSLHFIVKFNLCTLSIYFVLAWMVCGMDGFKNCWWCCFRSKLAPFFDANAQDFATSKWLELPSALADRFIESTFLFTNSKIRLWLGFCLAFAEDPLTGYKASLESHVQLAWDVSHCRRHSYFLTTIALWCCISHDEDATNFNCFNWEVQSSTCVNECLVWIHSLVTLNLCFFFSFSLSLSLSLNPAVVRLFKLLFNILYQ